MVFIQAVANEAGPAAACLELADGGPVELCLSEQVYAELRDVINQPSVRRKLRKLTDERIDEGFRRLARVAVLIPDVSGVFTLTRDPRDSKYLNLAIAAGAKLVVSRDNDLLDLMTGSDPDAETFRTAYPDIAILDPVAFLRIIRSGTQATGVPPAPPADPDAPSN